MQLTRTLLPILLTAAASFAQTVDLGLFGGSQHWFGNRKGGELAPGGVFGVRGGAELNSRWALEGAWTYGVNNLRAFPEQATGLVRPRDVGFGARNHHISLNPVWHFTESGQKWRPFLTAGVGALSFSPTDAARRDASLALSAPLGAAALKADLVPAFNWGGGVKYLLRDALHLRFDVRHLIASQPHFGLSRTPVIPGALFMERGGTVNGFQATVGLGFQVGRGGLCCGSGGGGAAAATSVASSSERPKGGSGRALDVDLNIASGSKTVPANGRTTLRASVKDPAPADLTYRWTVNGQGTDVTGPEFLFNAAGRQPGDYNICVSAMSTTPGRAPGTECYTVTVSAQSAPTVKVNGPLTLEPGSTATLTATGEVAGGAPIEYQWIVAGQPVASAGPTYNFGTDGRQPGVYPVCVTATANGISSEQACTSVTIRECTAPKLTLGGTSGAEIFAGERVNIPATAQLGSCGSPVRISFRAGDGSITGDAAGNTAIGMLDSTNVAFDRANRSKLQRKNVVVTATATDEKGHTAAAQSTVVVKLAPQAQRLDDVLFASGSSRVNNCGKRVLLEMLAPRLRDDPEARVLLIGHVDAAENGSNGKTKKKGRKRAASAALDRARVLNAAAVISAGTGICPSLELSRVKVAYAGKTQTSEVRPLFCGSSTERRATKGARARADQRAPFRRVEVWIVPNGAPLPAGVTIQDAPEREVKALSCPK